MSGGFIPNFLGASNGSSGGSQIGDQMTFMDVGTFYDKPNGERWIRSGQWVSPSLYPAAAQNKVGYLQATGQSSSALPSTLSLTAIDIATDGAGNWVIAFADATNVMVSVNNGSTWANVAHNAGGVVTSVCWDAKDSLFVCAGNTTVLFLTSTATAAGVASAWTARSGSVIVGGSANTARVRASSAEVVMVCGTGTTGNGSRSTNGTTWTATNLSTGQAALVACGLASLGGGIWVCANNGATASRSTDGGATWANVTYPAVFANPVFGNGVVIFTDASSGALYSSATGATGSFTYLGFPLQGYLPFQGNYGLSITFNGSVFVASVYNSLTTVGALGFYATSVDGSIWQVKTAIGRGAGWPDGGSTAIAAIVSDANGNYVMARNAAVSTTVVYGNLNTPTGIGFNRLSSSTAGTLPPTTQYARIK